MPQSSRRVMSRGMQRMSGGSARSSAFYVLAVLSVAARWGDGGRGRVDPRGAVPGACSSSVLAAMFMLLSADFVAVAQVLVYAGAIGVLVVFAVLLTPSGSDNPAVRRRCVARVSLPAAASRRGDRLVAFTTDWITAHEQRFHDHGGRASAGRSLNHGRCRLRSPRCCCWPRWSAPSCSYADAHRRSRGDADRTLLEQGTLIVVSVEHFLVLGAVLFGIGLWIALSKRNAVRC